MSRAGDPVGSCDKELRISWAGGPGGDERRQSPAALPATVRTTNTSQKSSMLFEEGECFHSGELGEACPKLDCTVVLEAALSVPGVLRASLAQRLNRSLSTRRTYFTRLHREVRAL